MLSDQLFKLDGPRLPRLALEMHARYGMTPGKRCRTCKWLIVDKHVRDYYKCTIYGVSNSASTDWRLS
jgi:hypothetical protein